MRHKWEEKEAMIVIQARIRGKAARERITEEMRASSADREVTLLKWVIHMQSSFRGRKARESCSVIKSRVSHNKSLLAALNTPFLQLKSVMSTDSVGTARIPMANMAGLDMALEPLAPTVVYDRQHHREIAMCALGTDAIAKDLQIMVVGTPCAKPESKPETRFTRPDSQPAAAADSSQFNNEFNGGLQRDFTPSDLSFLGSLAETLTHSLLKVAHYEALRTVMEQACLLISRRVAAGSAWGLLVEDADTMLWYCSTDRTRSRLIKLRIKRATHPTLFRALDEGDTVHLGGVWFDEVCAPGPGRCGGGLTQSDVLLMPIWVNGSVAAIIGTDLYGAADKLSTPSSMIDPKSSFTAMNRAVAEALAEKAGPCVQLLSGCKPPSDWSIAYLDITMKLKRQELVEWRSQGVTEVEAALAVPRKQTLVLIDALFKILDYRKPELETLSWTGKRDIFLATNMWNRMIRFHPDRWRGDYRPPQQHHNPNPGPKHEAQIDSPDPNPNWDP